MKLVHIFGFITKKFVTMHVHVNVKYIAYIFVILGSIVISRLHKLTLSEQDQVTLQPRSSPSDVVQKIFSR